MALSLGRLLGDAGVAAASMRQAEEAARVARQNQLRIEEQNRLELLRQGQQQVPEAVAPSFVDASGVPIMPTRQIAPPAPAPAPVAPAPTPGLVQPMSREQTAFMEANVTYPPVGSGRQAPVPAVPTAPGETPTQASTRTLNQLLDAQAALMRELREAKGGGRGRAATYQKLRELEPQIAAARTSMQMGARGLAVPSVMPAPTFPPAPAPAAPAPAPAAAPAGDWQLDAKGRPIRGLVNNNPGNIRPDTRYQWEGAVGVDKKENERAGFVQFATPEAGIRAMTINLLSYDARGIDTVQAVIDTWAPKSDQPGGNNAGYVQAIAKALGVKPTDKINIKDPATMRGLVESMIQFENGKQPYSQAVLDAGITAGMSRTSLPAAAVAPAAAAPAAAAPAAAAPAAAAPAAAAPAAAAPAAAAPAPKIKTSTAYLRNPNSITEDMRVAMQQREEMARLARLYRDAGMGAQFMEARAKVMEMDNGMMYLQGMQGIQEFSTVGDPRRLMAVWTQYFGAPVGLQPRSDGMFDLFVDGQMIMEGVSQTDVIDRARSSFDVAFRKQKAEAAATAGMKQFESMLKVEEARAAESAKMVREIFVTRAQGDNNIALEMLKQSRFDVKPTGDGMLVITPPGVGATPYLFNPSGRTIEVDNVKISPMSAYPIAGLPTYGGTKPRG